MGQNFYYPRTGQGLQRCATCKNPKGQAHSQEPHKPKLIAIQLRDNARTLELIPNTNEKTGGGLNLAVFFA